MKKPTLEELFPGISRREKPSWEELMNTSNRPAASSPLPEIKSSIPRPNINSGVSLPKAPSLLEPEQQAAYERSSRVISEKLKPKVAEPKNNPSVGQWLGANTKAGIGAFNRGLAATADMILPDPLTPKPVQNTLDYYKRKGEQYAQEAARVNQSSNTGMVGSLFQSLVSMAPNAALAVMSGGASMASSVPNAAAATGTLGSVVANTASQMASKPTFWLSASRIVGQEYEDAKKDGASELQAQATGIISGLLQAGVEVSGGIETFGEGAGGVKGWVKTMLDEGKEEVVQGVIENLTRKAMFAHDAPYASLSDPEAVLNPKRAAQEFAGGAIAGGILGGAQSGIAKLASLPRAAVDAQPNAPTPIPRGDAPTQPVAEPLKPATQAETPILRPKGWEDMQPAKAIETPLKADSGAQGATAEPTFGKNTVGAAESPLEIRSVKELLEGSDVQARPVDVAERLTGKGVSYNKDFARNLDAAAGGNKEARQWLSENVEKPFLDAKDSYSRNASDRLNSYKQQMDSLGIKKGSKESAAVQWIGEGQRQAGSEVRPYTLDDLRRDFPEKWQDIVKAEAVNRQMYSEYVDRINASLEKIYPNAMEEAVGRADRLKENISYTQRRLAGNRKKMKAATDSAEKATLQETVSRLEARLKASRTELTNLEANIESGEVLRNKRLVPRKDYYHHFSEMERGFGGLKNILQTPTDIDPKLVGVSDFTKPKSKWEGFMQARKGGAYVEDAVGGMQRYIPAAEYKVNIDPVIAHNRSIVKGLAEGTQDTRNANKFIEWMSDWTNDLAGKTNPFDRPLQKLTDRKVMRSIEWLNNRAKSNAVVGNLSSAVSQFFNIPNAAAYIKNPADWAAGSKHYIKNLVGSAEGRAFYDQSPFLRERYLQSAIDQFDEGILKVPEKFATWLLEVGDKEAAKLIWGSAHDQALRTGIPDAVRHADDITRRSIAGRGIGEVPLTQKSKIVKLLAPFQVEVNNTWQLLKERAGAKDAAGILSMFVVSWLMNNIAEGITGRRVSLDPIDAIVDGYNEVKDSDAAPLTKTGMFAGRVGGEFLSNMPGGSQVAQIATSIDSSTSQKLFGDNDPSRFGTGNIGLSMVLDPLAKAATGQDVDVLSPAANLLLPFGGRQVERTVRGLQDLAALPRERISTEGSGIAKQEFPASYSTTGRLRFPIEKTPLNTLKAATMGPFSTREGRNYLEQGLTPLSDNQTSAVQEASRRGIEPKMATDFLRWHALRSPDKDDSGEAIPGSKRKYTLDYLGRLPIPDKNKVFLFEAAGYKLKEGATFMDEYERPYVPEIAHLSDNKQDDAINLNKMGVPYGTYLTIQSKADRDGNKSVSQKEYALTLAESGLTRAEMAYAFKLQNDQWKRNPFEVAQQYNVPVSAFEAYYQAEARKKHNGDAVPGSLRLNQINALVSEGVPRADAIQFVDGMR